MAVAPLLPKAAAAAALAAILLLLAAGTGTDAQNTPQDFVNAHNSARRAIGVGLVYWDPALAYYAAEYAKNISKTCQPIPHPDPYGENYFRGYDGIDWSAADAVALWLYYQRYDCNNCDPYHMSECKAFLNLAWPNTLYIGCARIPCSNNVGGGYFIVCEYDPPRNFLPIASN